MMTEAYEIQVANWRDLSALRQLENECFGPDAWPLLDLIAALTFPDVIRLKVMHANTMIGFVGGDARRSEGLGWITTLAVLPQYRRRGVASALLTACEDALNLPRIRLCVRKDNEAAIRLYHKYGYTQIGTWPNYYQDGQDALVLEKLMP
jgi:ribosomal-protein-alanine N-acetyltransferase